MGKRAVEIVVQVRWHVKDMVEQYNSRSPVGGTVGGRSVPQSGTVAYFIANRSEIKVGLR